ncbi:hypothetical protein CXB51_005499 [Gossypium anomalum]|uniref:RNase H type-1 domain-containing protein n=1 Tax=Gossypium anomalum TaxID=47600 RepID=A0A8J5ZHZ4_9ROSI|nr:hypothetical protein CXB51_005499 [Gossypium anomalum]
MPRTLFRRRTRNSRNSFIFKGKEDRAQLIWDRASSLGKEFKIHNLLNVPVLSQNEAIKQWDKPPRGFVKLNFDATIKGNRMGYGAIIHDNDGFVLGGGGGFIDANMSVQEAECIAFERSIELVGHLNIKGDVLFETDHAGLVNIMDRCCTDITIIGDRIRLLLAILIPLV